MIMPGAQRNIAASMLRSGDYVYHEGRWVLIDEVRTDAGETTVILAPLIFQSDEIVGTCAAHVIADHG